MEDMSSTIKQLNAVGESAKEDRRPYEAHFRALGSHFLPMRTRFDQKLGHKSDEAVNAAILNAAPRYARRTLASGMHSGITSPARPWFRMQPKDRALRKNAAVKAHYDAAVREMRLLLQGNGLYAMLHTLWGDLGVFGYDAAIIEDLPDGRLHGQALVPGEAWLLTNGAGRPDALYREVEMTVRQLVLKFVYGNNYRTGNPRWDVVTKDVKRLWDNGNYTEKRQIRHLIMPRTRLDDLDLRDRKPVASVYWEEGESKRILGDRGYTQNPVIASRWEVSGTNTYGTSPGMETLPDARKLQLKERDYAEAVRRMNRPPMNAPVELRNSPFSLMPEAVNFMSDPSKGVVPAYQFNPPVGELRQDIRDTEEAVHEGMYSNLFMMIANLDRRQITAREVDERHEEKLIALGPVLERQHHEKLKVLLTRLYYKAIESPRVPPLPPEFDQMPAEIDYTSTLAQAMKAVATGGMERLYAFVGNVSAGDGSVLDKIDGDAAVDEYAEMVGVPSSILRNEDAVTRIRQGRQQQVERAQQLEQAGQVAQTAQLGAQAAKVLSEADAPRSPGGGSGILRDLGLVR